MRNEDAIIQGMCHMYPIFGMYSLHKLHVHKFVLFLDKIILNVSISLTDFISFGIEFHILIRSASKRFQTIIHCPRIRKIKIVSSCVVIMIDGTKNFFHESEI